MKACKTTCCRCGDKFDRFSGKLLNLSEEGLTTFYSIPFIQEYCNLPQHKHPTLCAKCLKELLGRGLKTSEIRFKFNKWMTSNVAYLIVNSNYEQSYKEILLERLKKYDKQGVLPFKHSAQDTKLMYETLLK